MKTLELKGQKRENPGSKEAKQLRNNDNIPCVIYGVDDPIHFSIELQALKSLIYTPDVFIAAIDIDGTAVKGVLKDVQFHPVNDKVLHVDFMAIEEGKKVKVDIPVRTQGNAIGVREGGQLALNVRKLRVEALPKDLPDFIMIDIAELNIGDKRRVADLNVDGVTFLDPENIVVVSVRVTRAAQSESDTAEADEEAKAEGEAGAEGEEKKEEGGEEKKEG